jgi:hypothetical protein
MRGAVCALLSTVLLLGACDRLKFPPGSREEPAPPRVRKHPMLRILETPPESQYEASLESALRYSVLPEAKAQICAQWYPEFDRAVVDAFREWRERNKAVFDDLRARSNAVWERRAGPDIGYVKMVYPRIRKQTIDALMYETDQHPVENFRQSCRNYPQEMRGARWNLEKRLWVELAVIRKQPPAAAAAGGPAQAASPGVQ